MRLKSLPKPLKWALAIIAGIIAGAAAVLFLYCLAIVAYLIFRLGQEALLYPHPNNQELTRNFLLAFAAVFGAPLLLWRAWVAHRQSRAATEQARIALENHVTGIFSKSVELMGLVREITVAGNDNVTRTVPNIEARLGALYSLERLLAVSDKDQRAILETLCAYIRENSPIEIPTEEPEASQFRGGDLPPKATRRVDVQAAITIIGRRPKHVRDKIKEEKWRLDFSNANLVLYDFSELNCDGAIFSNSFMNGADLIGTSFEGCIFKDTFLRFCNMKDARFDASSFEECSFEAAVIENTYFRRTKFVETDLRKAKITSLNIEGANLEKAFHLEYAIKAAKEAQSNGYSLPSYHLTDLLETFQFFKKATHDDQTVVSDAMREAVIIMTPDDSGS